MLTLQSLLLNKYTIAVVVTIAAILYHIFVVTGLERDLADMTSKYNTLATVTELQNKEVIRLEAISKQYGALLADAVKKNAEENKRWNTLYDKIRTDKIPVDCDGAMSHLRETTNEIAKRWGAK